MPSTRSSKRLARSRDDFALLMRAMSGPDYEQSWMVPCDMRLITSGQFEPELPHNALSDATALMQWCAVNGCAEAL